jgi:hypothetical protein
VGIRTAPPRTVFGQRVLARGGGESLQPTGGRILGRGQVRFSEPGGIEMSTEAEAREAQLARAPTRLALRSGLSSEFRSGLGGSLRSVGGGDPTAVRSLPSQSYSFRAGRSINASGLDPSGGEGFDEPSVPSSVPVESTSALESAAAPAAEIGGAAEAAEGIGAIGELGELAELVAL